ncbi:hypothetical protein [Nocardia sp. NPDC052316]
MQHPLAAWGVNVIYQLASSSPGRGDLACSADRPIGAHFAW